MKLLSLKYENINDVAGYKQVEMAYFFFFRFFHSPTFSSLLSIKKNLLLFSY